LEEEMEENVGGGKTCLGPALTPTAVSGEACAKRQRARRAQGVEQRFGFVLD
jgi:hypothetical protein